MSLPLEWQVLLGDAGSQREWDPQHYNLWAGCGSCKDLGAGCLCANFGLTEGARVQRGGSNEPDSREVSEGNTSLPSYIILAGSLVCSLHCGAVPCPRVCTACVWPSPYSELTASHCSGLPGVGRGARVWGRLGKQTLFSPGAGAARCARMAQQQWLVRNLSLHSLSPSQFKGKLETDSSSISGPRHPRCPKRTHETTTKQSWCSNTVSSSYLTWPVAVPQPQQVHVVF